MACYEGQKSTLQGSYNEVPRESVYGVETTMLTKDDDLKKVPVLHLDINLIAIRQSGLARVYLKDPASLRTQIQVSAGSDWEPLLVIDNPEAVGQITPYLTVLKALGLIPNTRLRIREDSSYTFDIRQATQTLAVRRWSRCSLHSQAVPLDQV